MKLSFVSKTLIATLIFISLLFIFPKNFEISEVSTLFTAVALLFGIIAGFFIAATLTNYFKLQSLVTIETSKLIYLYELVLTLAPSLKKKINQAIDNYIISTMDFELADYVENTWNDFDKIIQVTKEIKKNNSQLYSDLLDTRNKQLETRQEMTLTARSIIGKSHWATLIILALTTVFLLYVMKEPSIESSIFTVLLSSVTFLVLFLLYDIDNNIFAEEQLAFSVYEVVFKRLGNLPYFSELDLKAKRIKLPKTRRYRIGIYKNYPKTMEKEIKIIKI